MRIKTKGTKKKDVIRNLVRDAEWDCGYAANELADVLNGKYKDDPERERTNLEHAVHELMAARAGLLAVKAMLEES